MAVREWVIGGSACSRYRVTEILNADLYLEAVVLFSSGQTTLLKAQINRPDIGNSIVRRV